jgi:streptogramin lyase
LSAYRLALISYDDQYSEIWVLSNNWQGIFQYRTDTQEWIVNKTGNIEDISLLFLDKEGNVWSARVNYLGPSFTSLPFLSRYDKEKGEFIPVYDNGDTWTLTVSSVKVDDEGIFWMMVDNRGVHQLTSFNPSTLKATIQLESPDYGYSLEISPDNKILFGDQKDNSLIVYSPDTGKVDSYKIPLTVYFGLGVDLFLDSYGRLWVNDFGWMDLSTSTSHQWFTVVRSPIFIDFPEGIGQWGWTSPTFSTESADGLLWFRSIRGTGWLDTNTGTWCLFTTYDSDILQDNEHNLWMLADGKLFERIGVNP